jgi:ribosomal protein S12 methylthiotransferase
VFTFSPEEETPSYTLPHQVSPDLKEDRRNRLMECQQPISSRKNADFIDRTIDVLIEQENPDTEEYIGRCARFAPEVDGLVYVQGQAALNTFVSVRITHTDTYDLYGLVNP